MQLHDVLHRTRTRRGDVARHRERARPEVQHPQGHAGVAASVDHGRDEPRVLELEVERIERIDVRLRGALDDEGVAAVGAALGKEPRTHLLAVEFESGIAHAFHTRSGACGRPDAASTSGSSEWSSPRRHRRVPMMCGKSRGDRGRDGIRRSVVPADGGRVQAAQSQQRAVAWDDRVLGAHTTPHFMQSSTWEGGAVVGSVARLAARARHRAGLPGARLRATRRGIRPVPAPAARERPGPRGHRAADRADPGRARHGVRDEDRGAPAARRGARGGLPRRRAGSRPRRRSTATRSSSTPRWARTRSSRT